MRHGPLVSVVLAGTLYHKGRDGKAFRSRGSLRMRHQRASMRLARCGLARARSGAWPNWHGAARPISSAWPSASDGGEGKSRRAPGALPKPGDAVTGEPLKHSGDAGADIGSALHRREIGAHRLLQIADLIAESLEVLVGERRQRSLQDTPGEIFGFRLREIWQRGEGRDLVRPMHAGLGRIEDKSTRQSLGKGTRQSTSGSASSSGPPSSTAPPCSNVPMPMPDRLPRSSRARNPGEVERQAFQHRDGGADGERKLRARSEPGMRRDHLVEMQMIGRGEAEARQRSRGDRARRVRTRRPKPRSRCRAASSAAFAAGRSQVRSCRRASAPGRSDRESRNAGARSCLPKRTHMAL